MWAVPSVRFLELPGELCLDPGTSALRSSAPHYNLTRGCSWLHFTDVQTEALKLRWTISTPTFPFVGHPGGSAKPLVHSLVVVSSVYVGGYRRSSQARGGLGW